MKKPTLSEFAKWFEPNLFPHHEKMIKEIEKGMVSGRVKFDSPSPILYHHRAFGTRAGEIRSFKGSSKKLAGIEAQFIIMDDPYYERSK